MVEKVRILLADDHPTVCAGIRTILAKEADLMLVGEATDGYEAQHLTEELSPHVLLLDLSMAGPSAVETVAYVRERCPGVRVLVLTAYEDDAYICSLVEAGISGYVLKDESPQALVRAIRSMVQGDTWFSRSVMERLARLRLDGSSPLMPTNLTQREWQILSLMARGWDNTRIAVESFLAEQTVRNYASRIYAKIGVRSRAEAVIWARERGMI